MLVGMDEIITKRLHISGITPGLTKDDLSKRLSTFGTLKSMDGFGLNDVLGQPRKFGYVTLETTQSRLSKCLNSLSGSTWKGAKLRIGEARPDYAERLAAERELDALVPPRKKRKRSAGTHAADMSLITPENVAGRSGWKVTPLGRIVRPVRMRPERPLPLPLLNEDKAKRARAVKIGVAVKKSKRIKDPDVRARRRKIDMTRYGSVYMKGMFLEMDVLGTRRDEVEKAVHDVEIESSQSESSRAGRDETGGDGTSIIAVEHPPDPRLIDVSTLSNKVSTSGLSTAIAIPNDDLNITNENVQSLSLIASLFGNAKDPDWMGRESVGSDIDELELTKDHHRSILDSGYEDFETVPMDTDIGGVGLPANEGAIIAEEMAQPPPTPANLKQQQAKNLKDLFAPREDDAMFSLLGHLELDLELDDEVVIPEGTFAPEPTQNHSSIIPTSFVSSHSVPQINNKLPLFFPLPSAHTLSTKARPKDILDVARENKWHWRDPSVGFFRTGSEEDIREHWENSKVELTREWKRRWKEAGKINRRRTHGVSGDAEGVGA